MLIFFLIFWVIWDSTHLNIIILWLKFHRKTGRCMLMDVENEAIHHKVLTTDSARSLHMAKMKQNLNKKYLSLYTCNNETKLILFFYWLFTLFWRLKVSFLRALGSIYSDKNKYKAGQFILWSTFYGFWKIDCIFQRCLMNYWARAASFWTNWSACLLLKLTCLLLSASNNFWPEQQLQSILSLCSFSILLIN